MWILCRFVNNLGFLNDSPAKKMHKTILAAKIDIGGKHLPSQNCCVGTPKQFSVVETGWQFLGVIAHCKCTVIVSADCARTVISMEFQTAAI